VTLYRLAPDGTILRSTAELRFEGSGPSPLIPPKLP